MNQTHIHLLITHLPIFGSILGGLVLAHGLWTNSNQTKIAAYNLFIISAIGAGIAYLTGEAAEETVENIQGVLEATIKQHEEFALFALISLIILGLTSIVGLFITLKNIPLTRTVAFIILFISLISFGLVARTGYLGGQIRHTEIASSTNLSPVLNEKNGDND
ncbi:MAG: hypothetical protein IPQ02_09985 [Saprospiraceae bacterium]|jgi:uncharacterized protein YacL|uniref:DUF2231 domain-containing protein n=1 Tax=Candidatus Defluviibacterium haderslevense TaxID=2981993 RepID=A0A9D7SAX7_9BACT|nr:hypothetical protein [Candidatus Defluviibacterium haderslevense]MBL0236921.1 hypothetical protein [Candidatus Defluviibacterium haderslevense]